MNTRKSGFPIVVFATLFVGLALSIMQHFTQSGRSAVGQPVAQVADPARDLSLMVVVLTPKPAPPPKAHPMAKPQPTPVSPSTSYIFTDAVPVADSPEIQANDMNACFSMYTRKKNEAENMCKGEWYPADQAPRSYDQFWCATNSGGVGWLPVRFFDGRSNQVVNPCGSLNRCD